MVQPQAAGLSTLATSRCDVPNATRLASSIRGREDTHRLICFLACLPCPLPSCPACPWPNNEMLVALSSARPPHFGALSSTMARLWPEPGLALAQACARGMRAHCRPPVCAQSRSLHTSSSLFKSGGCGALDAVKALYCPRPFILVTCTCTAHAHVHVHMHVHAELDRAGHVPTHLHLSARPLAHSRQHIPVRTGGAPRH